ncbi:MAG: hypothetical protein DCC67_11505 [Planctomycetota bacterium]|nr:MAG: hypothetical protein DCC67_11505 [Planctomycetota bacterium]
MPRALELMDEAEAIIRAKLGGRLSARLGPWSVERSRLEAWFRQRFFYYGGDLSEYEFDSRIWSLLARWAHADIEPPPPAPPRSPYEREERRPQAIPRWERDIPGPQDEPYCDA